MLKCKLYEPKFDLKLCNSYIFIIIFSDSALTDPEIGKFFVPEKIEEYRGFGGVRIEDDIIITKDGCEVNQTIIKIFRVGVLYSSRRLRYFLLFVYDR